MWITIFIGLIGLGLGFLGGYWFNRSSLGPAQEHNNLAKKIFAVPYVFLDFLGNSKFNALSPDNKVDFITEFFRKEMKDLKVATYTTTPIALDDFYRRKRLNPLPPKPPATGQ